MSFDSGHPPGSAGLPKSPIAPGKRPAASGGDSPEPTPSQADPAALLRERLRQRAKTAEHQAPPELVSGEDTSGARLLVVDDSPTFRRAIGGMLARVGFEVETAESGEEALERCLNESFSAVISDVTMGALSGVQLCRLLCSDPSTKETPVVLLTAADDPRSRFWGRNAGAAAYVAKEDAREQLVAEVKRVLPRGERSPAPAQARSARRTQPLERLSQVLDGLLFRAVVASEMQRLVHHTSDRQQFARGFAGLASEVCDYGLLCLRLSDTSRDTVTIHAREPFPTVVDETLLARLHLAGDPLPHIEVILDAEGLAEGAAVELRDSVCFPIVVADEELGELRAFGLRKRLGGDDRETLRLLAEQAALLVKNLRLLEETARLAHTDGLTGLHNRRRVSGQLDMEVERARRYSVPLSIALCDLDHFKSVNDTYGHNVGDDVLRAVARTLSGAVRVVDQVGRWGGEEFLVVLPETDLAGARVVAERIRAAVAAIPAFADGPASVTCSIGLSSFRGEATGPKFTERADRALYRAKEAGRNRVEIFEDET